MRIEAKMPILKRAFADSKSSFLTINGIIGASAGMKNWVTRETAKVIATQIESLAEVQKKRTHSVHLSFKTTELQVDQLQNLKFVLGQHQGNCPVFLHMFLVDKEEEIHTIVQLSDQTRVIPCDLLVKDIEKIFGKKVVRFE